jgi:F-type H+-transporting ATPase subunit gamma
MPSLKEVKNRIGSVISTQQITKAMKMVAAAKLRRSQERITQMRPFAQRLSFILQNISSSQEGEQR